LKNKGLREQTKSLTRSRENTETQVIEKQSFTGKIGYILYNINLEYIPGVQKIYIPGSQKIRYTTLKQGKREAVKQNNRNEKLARH